MDVSIRMENVQPETWVALHQDNPYWLPLDAEHDSGWHDWVDYSPNLVLTHLEALGSPKAKLYVETLDSDGCRELSRYQLDSLEALRIDKFNRKLCQVLGLQPVRELRMMSRCPALEWELPTTKTLDGSLRVSIQYRYDGRPIHYAVTVSGYDLPHMESFTTHFTVYRLSNVRYVLGRIERLIEGRMFYGK